MYESFYGLREKPFSLLPDPEFLYLGGRYRTAWGLLEYGLLNQAGFIVITGETGTGKTTLLRKLLAEAREECTVGILAYTHGAWNSLMPWILMAFDLSWKGKDAIEQFQSFSEFLMEQVVKGRRVVLIVDEAQNLAAPMLEELRLLSNLNSDKVPMLQIILSGQPGLRTLLQRPELSQFAQRVAVDYTLEAMDEKDTREYIRHRIAVAGGNADLFSPQACTAAHRLTGGLPRLVNQVCDTALAYGFAEQARQISVRLVADAAKDRTVGCIVPLAVNVDLSDLREDTPAVPLRAKVDSRPVLPKEVVSPPPPAPPKPAVATPSVRSVESAQADPEMTTPSPERAPVSAEEWLQRGQLLRKRGRHKDAVRALAEAWRDTGVAFRAYSEAGHCYREAGRINEAVEAFRKAFSDRTAARDDRVAVCYELGRTLETARKPAEALDCYQRVQRVDPTFQDVGKRIERLSGEVPSETASASRMTHSPPEHSNGSWLGSVFGGLKRMVKFGGKSQAVGRRGRR